MSERSRQCVQRRGQSRTVWRTGLPGRAVCPLTLWAAASTESQAPMSQVYRALLVGTGSVAALHMQAIEQTRGRVTLAAAVDVDAERLRTFCAQHNVAHAYEDFATALKAVRPD